MGLNAMTVSTEQTELIADQKSGLLFILDRYIAMAGGVGNERLPSSVPRLLSVAQSLLEEEEFSFAIAMKVNRWIGFCQAYLCEAGLTTVDTERDWTRPVFHRMAELEGAQQPPTVAV